MGYMFYTNLGGIQGSFPGIDFTDGATGETRSFQNLQPVGYWSGTESGSFPEDAWHFFFAIGTQDTDYKGIDNFYYTWPVRPGESAPVPEPATMPWIPLLLLDD